MKNILAILSLCILTGCITPFDEEVNEGEKKLVVSGLITDEPGPYTVKLDKTIFYGRYFGTADASVLKAQVTITDDLGAVEVLKETKNGEYKTNAGGIRGRIGGTYTLHIKLQDGTEYISAPETIKPIVPFSKLDFVYKDYHVIDKDGIEVKNPTFEVQVDLKDPAEENFYRWTSFGTYEVATQPEDFSYLDFKGNLIKAPKPCCRQCWINKNFTLISVSDDRLFNGKNLVGKSVLRIPMIPEYFGVKFRLEVSQMSISEQAYNFWSTFQEQSSGTGNVQDPAPANVIGNMRKLGDDDTKVLGFFGASAVVRKVIYKSRNELPVSILDFIYPDDCLTIPGATTNKPSFWQ